MSKPKHITQILLLGSFHFHESNFDFFTDDAQLQLHKLCESIAKFAPDVVAVESLVSAQKDVDKSYTSLNIDDFDDYDKMKSNLLGGIYSYQNEIVQLGYRVGKMLNLDKIYAIDADSPPDKSFKKYFKKVDGNFMSFLSEWHKHHGTDMSEVEKVIAEYRKRHATDTIIELMQYINSEKHLSDENNAIYMAMNQAGAGTTYEGAKFTSSWYERNLRIFANIQNLAQKHERIFIVYGASHLSTLRHFIASCKNMQLVDTNEILREL